MGYTLIAIDADTGVVVLEHEGGTFGEVAAREYSQFRFGKTYKFKLRWNGSDPKLNLAQPDFDGIASVKPVGVPAWTPWVDFNYRLYDAIDPETHSLSKSPVVFTNWNDKLDFRASVVRYASILIWLDDHQTDTDNDDLLNSEEVHVYGTNPTLSDTDVDGMPDGWEVRHGLRPLEDDATLDPDDDELDNLGELQAGTDPHSADTDFDELPDGWEVAHGLDPLDSLDVFADVDNDGVLTWEEFELGTDPTSAADVAPANGIPDDYEKKHNLINVDPDGDLDNDGLTNLQESQHGTDPHKSDTDGDDIGDKLELLVGMNPRDGFDGKADLDGDGLSTAEELTRGTNPNSRDSDGDGYGDGREVAGGSQPMDPTSKPTNQGPPNEAEPPAPMGDSVQMYVAGKSLSTAVSTQGKREPQGSYYLVREDGMGDSADLTKVLGIGGVESMLSGFSEGKFVNRGEIAEQAVTSSYQFNKSNCYSCHNEIAYHQSKRIRLQRKDATNLLYEQVFLRVSSSRDLVNPNGDETIDEVKTVKLIVPANETKSEEVELKAQITKDKISTVRLLPVEMFTDLNNDGKIDLADSALSGNSYKEGATEDEIAKGTEYMFANDEISNGASDGEDTTIEHESFEDDDAEGIHIKVGLSRGEIWLEHEAIDALTFYGGKECYPDQKINIKEANPFDLAGETPLPETIYARCDEDFDFPEDNPQSLGDLILKFLMPGGGGQPVIAAKTKLVVVKTLGSTEHHRGAMDYINEKNATGYTGKVTRKGSLFDRSTYYSVMFESRTGMYGINAGPKSLKGITLVKDSADWKSMTAIINATYNYDATTPDNGFVHKHQGEQYVRGHTDPATNTHWDQTCSVKLDPRVYLAYGGAGVFATGMGHVPATASDGSGALKTEADIAGSPEAYTLVAFVTVGSEKLLFVASSEWSVMSGETAGNFHAALKKGATAATIIHCDGGRNVALATENASGTGMVTRIEGPAHQGFPTTLYPKTYLGFKANIPRP